MFLLGRLGNPIRFDFQITCHAFPKTFLVLLKLVRRKQMAKNFRELIPKDNFYMKKPCVIEILSQYLLPLAHNLRRQGIENLSILLKLLLLEDRLEYCLK